jgi:hypothetical protein
MLEQLHSQFSSASYQSAQQRHVAAAAVAGCLSDLGVLGVNTRTADSGPATSVATAISIVRSAVSKLSVSASFSTAQREQALGYRDALRNDLASAGLV